MPEGTSCLPVDKRSFTGGKAWRSPNSRDVESVGLGGVLDTPHAASRSSQAGCLQAFKGHRGYQKFEKVKKRCKLTIIYPHDKVLSTRIAAKVLVTTGVSKMNGTQRPRHYWGQRSSLVQRSNQRKSHCDNLWKTQLGV